MVSRTRTASPANKSAAACQERTGSDREQANAIWRLSIDSGDLCCESLQQLEVDTDIMWCAATKVLVWCTDLERAQRESAHWWVQPHAPAPCLYASNSMGKAEPHAKARRVNREMDCT